jgi:hypothetical protein
MASAGAVFPVALALAEGACAAALGAPVGAGAAALGSVAAGMGPTSDAETSMRIVGAGFGVGAGAAAEVDGAGFAEGAGCSEQPAMPSASATRPEHASGASFEAKGREVAAACREGMPTA